jgi:hypothetical protein
MIQFAGIENRFFFLTRLSIIVMFDLLIIQHVHSCTNLSAEYGIALDPIEPSLTKPNFAFPTVPQP